MTIPDVLNEFLSTHASLLKPKNAVLVACSGGPDSVGLVTALKNLSGKKNIRFQIGHVNHALRQEESNWDADFVKKLASRVRFRFHSAKCPVSPAQSGNVEEQARDKRYEALVKMARQTGCQLILTGHNFDDQVETILMNLARGAGSEGLSGMAPLRKMGRDQIYLGRPFLHTSKEEILAYVNQARASFRWDHTNADQAYMRNWMRGALIPMWEARMPGLKKSVVNLAQILRDEQEAWSLQIQSNKNALVKPFKGGTLLDLKKLQSHPLAFQRRFLREVIGSDLLTFDHGERLRNWMFSPPSGGRHFQLKKGGVVERLSKSKGSPSPDLFWINHRPLPFNKTKKK